MSRIITPTTGDHMSTTVVPPVSCAAATSTFRLHTATWQDKVSVTVAEPEDLHTVTVASVTATDSSIEVIELSTRPIQPQARPKIRRLNKKKAAVLADRVAKAESKQKEKLFSQKKRFCRWCNISCNFNKVFYNHNQSRKHLRAVQNQTTDLNCSTCNREFRTALDLATHKLSSAHIKAARARREGRN